MTFLERHDFFKLDPNRVWRTYLGGKSLDMLEGKSPAIDSHFPEDWIASTTKAMNVGREDHQDEGFSSIIIDQKRESFPDFINKHAELVFSPDHLKRHGPKAGFLLKLLDSAIRLHIQCHPTVDFAQKFCNSFSGKTEAYYILATRPEVKHPYIFLGFQHHPTREEFKSAIHTQNIPQLESFFEKIPVKPGDCFIVPGGIPHAIGEGVFMVEIMEPTDLAVRIEFEKAGYVLPEKSRFMGHDIDFAISMFNFEEIPVSCVYERFFHRSKIVSSSNSASLSTLIDSSISSHFRLSLLKVNGVYEYERSGFYIMIVVKGDCIINDHGSPVLLKYGEKILVPYCTKKLVISSKMGVELLLAFPPD